MNWFISEPISAESVLEIGLPLLEAFAMLAAIIAVFTLAIAVLHLFLAVRSLESRAASVDPKPQRNVSLAFRQSSKLHEIFSRTAPLGSFFTHRWR